MTLSEMMERAKRAYADMTPQEKKAHDDAQRASWVRGMTARCEHGIVDFEQCPDCQSIAQSSLSAQGRDDGR